MLIQTTMKKNEERFLFDATEVQGLHEVMKRKEGSKDKVFAYTRMLIAGHWVEITSHPLEILKTIDSISTQQFLKSGGVIQP